MTNRKGTISVDTTDIFPIIKKWLYSEHDIFMRELVSNACDAITKRKSLANQHGQAAPAGEVKVIIDKTNNTLTFKDNGLGMTEEEIEKYIAKLAFSGAEEFVQKMKDTTNAKDEIIGKFGLGFYSAFMVADKVEINSLSMTPGSKATKWICAGDTDYTFSDSDMNEIGTEITLYINDESKDFLESYKTRQTLKSYCDFMPYPIELVDLEARQRIIEENAKATKEEDKKPLPNDIVNNPKPLWKKEPASLKDEDYIKFYRELFPMDPEPLFWLHLNVDHPFTLQGILYFPKVNLNKPELKSNIRLYSKQVFVSDNVKDVIPEFLGLLKGAIDSTDIPLNVSRSSLQGDPNVKKISNYIIKKVADALKKLNKTDRERYEKVWPDISLFVKYGVLSDEKFDTEMRSRVLFETAENKLITLKEYSDLIPKDFQEKLKDKIIYFEKNSSDESLKKKLILEKIPVILTDDYLDPHFMQHVEFKKQGDTEFKFSAIDTEVENLFESANTTPEDLKIKEFFDEILSPPKAEGDTAEYIELKKVSAMAPAYFKVDQAMKRFQNMNKTMGNSQFEIPVRKTLVVNPDNNLVKNAYKLWNGDKKDLAKDLCFYIQDLAELSSEGLTGEKKENFVTRSQSIMEQLSNLAL